MNTQTLEHYFVSCCNNSLIKKILLVIPFSELGLTLTANAVLNFELRNCPGNVFEAACNFIQESKCMPI